MTSITTVGKCYGDVVLRNVLCDNVKVHKNRTNDQYTLTFGFSNNCGLMGLLFSKIRSGYRDAPTFMVQASVDLTTASMQVPSTHAAYVRGHQTIDVSTVECLEKFTNISPGTYSVSTLAQYNIVFSAVIDVKVKNVHVADQQCCSIVTNAVLHGGVSVLELYDMEARLWFRNNDIGTLGASKHSIDGVIDFEESRHRMAR